MDLSKAFGSEKKDEKAEIIDHETGEVLDRAQVVGNHEMALTFPAAVAFEHMSTEELGYVYAVHKAAEKILKERLGAMNEVLKKQMSAAGTKKMEYSDVRVTHDVPEDPEPVKSLSLDKLAEAMGTDHMGLVEMGLAECTMTVTVKGLDELLAKVADPSSLNLDSACNLEDAIEEATVVTTPKPRADRIIVTPQGELKKALASVKKKALPQKSRAKK